jgi:hypothetical protein
VIDILMPLIKQFMPFAQKQIGFKKPPKLFLKQDAENAENPLGKTAHYDPQEQSVTLYISGRHPKDILRSLGHELVHHKQNCDGQFDDAGEMGEGYAQNNPHLRAMEFEANSLGSMCLRDFEDGLRERKTIYYEHLQKGENTMSTKDWKNNELNTLLTEAWGFKFNTLQEFDEFNGTGEIQEESEEIDPATGKKWEANEAGDEPWGYSTRSKTTKKGDKLKDTEDDGARGEKKGDEADVNEASRTDRPDRVAGRDTGGRRLDEDDLEEITGVGGGAADPRARRKPHGTGQRVEDEPEEEKEDEKKEKEVAAEGLGSDPQQQLREAIGKMLRKHL